MYRFLVLAVAVPLSAQCIVDNPGGSKVNTNRPANTDVPVATFSPLAEINKALPGWLCFTGGFRARAEGYSNANFLPNNSDSFMLTRFRFGMLIKPEPWLKLFTEVQNADVFGKKPPLAPPYQETWDLRRAYVDLGNIEESPIAFRVGRQDLNLGYGRLVGTSYWRNASRGFDAAEGVVNWRRFRLTAFSASQVILGGNGLSHHQAGNDLHGLYGGIKDVIPGSVIEPYMFWHVTRGLKAENGKLSKLDEKTVGMRLAGGVSRFDWDAEVAGQTGNLGTDTIGAWAWTDITGYTFRDAPLEPRLFAEYDFASGDHNAKDGKHGAFDQLFPNVHDHHGLADQIAWQNLKEIRTGARVNLRRNWTLAAMWNDWWLASATDALYNSSGGALIRDTKGRSGTHIGEEYDTETSYRFNRDIEIGAGVGHILPGGFLALTKHGQSYTYPYLMVNYNFF